MLSSGGEYKRIALVIVHVMSSEKLATPC